MERQVFSGIERRLDRLRECLDKLEPFREKAREDFEYSAVEGQADRKSRYSYSR